MPSPGSREERELYATREVLNSAPHVAITYRIKPAAGLTLESAAAKVALITGARSLRPLVYENLQTRLKLAGHAVSHGIGTGLVTLAFPLQQVSRSERFTQLLPLMTSGAEYSYTDSIWIEDIHLPDEMAAWFRGPRFGPSGIRDVTNVRDRPIFGVEIKPRFGVSMAEIGAACNEAILGGADFICDDLLLVDPEGELSARSRIPYFVQLARDASKRTKRTVSYFANVGLPPIRAYELAKWAISRGVSGLILNPWAMGLAGAEELITLLNGQVPVLASNMGIGITTRPAMADHQLLGAGISEVVISKLSRLLGADGVNAGTSYSECYIQEAWGPAIQALRTPFYHLNNCLPVAEGDLTIATIWENIRDTGTELMLQLCSGLSGYPGGPRKGASAFRILLEELHPDMTHEEAVSSIEKLGKKYDYIAQGLDFYDYDPDRWTTSPATS